VAQRTTPRRDIPDALRIKPGSRPKLSDSDADRSFGWDKDKATAATTENLTRLEELQYKMYADGRFAMLLALQAIDGGGKDSTIRRVFGAFNPQGCTVTAFKGPSAEELRHDYLWRIHKHAPPRGEIAVFNRSHYEDVLIVRVHDLVPPDVWGKRYEIINDFEKRLVADGTTIIKVAMFVSLDEQKKRLAKRLERPDKYWKYNPADVDERLLWPKYQEAYQAMLERTSTEYAPWHVIPCDRKWYSRLAITELLIEALERLDLSWPPASFDVEAEKKRLNSA